MSTEAFNFTNEIQARKNSPDLLSWQRRVDDNLKYFTQEYIIEADLTKYSYGLKRDENGIPNQIYSYGYEIDGDILRSFEKGEGLRARAECFGFGKKIEAEVFSGRVDNDFFVWHSPPGKKEDGFKDHNFTFIGQVLEDKIDVIAYRNHLSKSEAANFLNNFLDDGERLDKNSSDVDFLKNPVFLRGRERFNSHMDVIRALDPKRSNMREESCRWLLDMLEPFRKDIVEALENEDKATAEKSKNAHDNFALALLHGEVKEEAQGYKNKKHWESLGAPVLRGSCGFSGKNATVESLTWQGAEEEYFECPSCQGHIPKGKGITVCPHCGARKEDYGNCG
jgi:hypothetical protein